MSAIRFYALGITGCIASWTWIAMSINQCGQGIWKGCLIKYFLHIPCPACGSTRAIIAIIDGHIQEALALNPLGFVLLALLILLTVGIPYDYLRRQHNLYHLFTWADTCLHIKSVFIPTMSIILLNWLHMLLM